MAPLHSYPDDLLWEAANFPSQDSQRKPAQFHHEATPDFPELCKIDSAFDGRVDGFPGSVRNPGGKWTQVNVSAHCQQAGFIQNGHDPESTFKK